jgi:cell cycle sensor histidine kinase DivJ
VFLASVTHELRTPIHGVSGLAELIATGVYGPPTDRQKQAAQAIKQSAQSLLHLVDDLLALVRAEVGRVEIQATTFALGELVEQVTASVGWMLGTKQLTLATDVADAIVTTDRRLVSHVLVNLVANAAKFTPAGGRVDVGARVDGERLVLTVADTGRRHRRRGPAADLRGRSASSIAATSAPTAASGSAWRWSSG